MFAISLGANSKWHSCNPAAIICDRGQGGNTVGNPDAILHLLKGTASKARASGLVGRPHYFVFLAVMASYHLVFVLVTSIQAVKLDPYEAAMMDEETIANELLDEFYGDVYDLRPESKDFLPDDYFDLGGQPENTVSKDTPTFTEQVKKALMKSAKKKKTKSSSLQTTNVDSASKNKDQNRTETIASIRPPSSRDPTFVLSRLLYHMAQLPTP